MMFYSPFLDCLDALDSICLTVLLHIGVDAWVMCQQVRLRAAVRHCTELERRRHFGRVPQLSTRAKSKPKLYSGVDNGKMEKTRGMA